MNVTATVTSMASEGAVMCPRCRIWHFVSDNYDRLCDRCCDVILEVYPTHESVSGILEAYAKQRVKYG